MSIKISLRMLLNRFEMIGEIMLFLLVFAVLFCSLGAIFVQPIIQSAVDLGLGKNISDFFASILSRNEIAVIYENGQGIVETVKQIFVGKEGIIFETVAVPVLLFVIFNLFANMYELPLCKVLEGRMSSNAKLSLMGNVISLAGKSSLYVLVRLLFTVITDVIFFFIMWGGYKLLTLSSMTLLIPFVLLLLFFTLISLRRCFIVVWIENIVIGKMKIFPALAQSAKSGFGHFWSVFSRYFVCWLIVYVFNGLMALLTFGVGLIISIPASVLFLKIFEMTAYYSWNNMRFYLDGNTIIGPKQELTENLN